MPYNPAPLIDDVMLALDQAFENASSGYLEVVNRTGRTGIMAQRIAELNAEASRLMAAGESLGPDNAVFNALLNDLDRVMQTNQALVSAAADGVAESGAVLAGEGVRQLTVPPLTDTILSQLGVEWQVPDPNALRAVMNYTTSPEWSAKLSRYGNEVVQRVRNIAVRGMVNGWNPYEVANMTKIAVDRLPVTYAENMLRTLQLTANRDAAVLHRVANSRILEYQIRIAALDNRVCMACIALHGTTLDISERIDDHHRGRCTSITKVRGFPTPEIETGVDWFARQPEHKQQKLMGKSAWRAWRDKAFELKDYPQPYTDDVFGGMIGAKSLRGLLGPEQALHYRRVGR